MNNTLDLSMKEILESDIFDYLELESVPEEDKIHMMENLMVSLRSRVMIRIADMLEEQSKEKFEQFKKLLNTSDLNNSEIEKFLKENNINIEVLVAEESILLKSEIMSIKGVRDREE
ncbi:MAG: hypothetical protein M1324_04690 [Patescibacteria group bacterium]|nr:hypothetical protein [Patescibacteria group bacterium]